MIQRTLLSICLVMCPLGRAVANDWPQWRGPDRTGVSKETGLLPSWPPGGPKLLWIFRDAGEGHSCTSVVGDRLYSMGTEGDKDCVFALDLKTQKKVWSLRVGARFQNNHGNGPRSTPTIDGNYLYTIGGYGNLVCVETASGKKVWSRELQNNAEGRDNGSNGYSESPLVDGDQVIATVGDGKKGAITAFDKKTGTLKWRSTLPITTHARYSSKIAIESGGVRQYVHNTYCREVAGVRASDGKPLWRFACPDTEVIDTPIYHNDSVYICSSAGGCRLLKLMPDGDQFKAELIYRNREMANEFSGVIRVGEYLYGCSYQSLACQDFKTGKSVWKKHPGMDMGEASVVFADGNLCYYHQNKGDVLLIKATPDGYQELGKFRIPERSKLPREGGKIWTSPVVANGKLYLRDQNLIFCYDVRKPQ